ncbi:hypothetical protein K2173_003378 [Erythroxylum novogranatense]|uniref:Uncharacterized protein n=1 Tax=Erythroxylum novogranatense TaxID=1862640 RepID=A0AAV8S8F8_9ROSI|nr:hypothetical protein K2173_003378 [Erythroxylum novogranatense]
MNSTPDEAHLNQVEDGKDEIIGYAMQLALGSVLPMTLKAAIELGVFEIIAREGSDAKLSASDIAAKISTQNPDAPLMLDRILRLLASHQVLGCTSVDGQKRFYSLTPVAKYFVRDQSDLSLAPPVEFVQDKVYLASWFELKNAVAEGGIPFNRTYGMNIFEYAALNPRFNQIFNSVMFNSTSLVAKSILESYKGFEHLKQLVDVGGGLGHTIHAITSKYPHIKGINFDLPHVVAEAPTYSGVEHVGGDMFQSVPNGDAIFIKVKNSVIATYFRVVYNLEVENQLSYHPWQWILHNWSDHQCLKLLQNCYKAIPENGKVIVVEGILPVVPETSATDKCMTQMDLLMMTQTPGGKERTKHEFLALATRAGYAGIEFKCFVSNYWVMEFFK